MTSWVLIVMLSTPGGDFIDKKVEFVHTKVECQAKANQVDRRTLFGIRQDPLCVTMDHWTGKNPMKGVALD